ncbi:MAG: hypothetical protein RPT25_10635 [Cycloclasticus sp.]
MPLSSTSLLLTFASAMFYQIVGHTAIALLTAASLMLFIVLEWRETNAIGKLMVAIVVAVASFCYFYLALPEQVLLDAMSRAGFFVALFVGIGLLREATEVSQAIQRCGEYLVSQPPSRRYFTLAFGSHVFSIVLSIGTLSLLSGIVNKNNTLESAQGNREVWDTRQRRMSMAIMRGFNATIYWSPFSLALIVTSASLEGGVASDFYGVGFVCAMVLLFWGWLLDFLSTRGAKKTGAEPVSSHERWPILLNLLGLVVVVFIISLAVAELIDSSLLVGMLVSVPIVCVPWMMLCMPGPTLRQRFQQTAARLKLHAVEQFPSYRSEASMVGTAGALGVLLSAAVPKEMMAELLSSLHLSGLPLAIALVLTILVAGQLALVPLVTVSILASVLPAPELLGLRYEVLVLAFVGGWAFATQSSVFSGTTLVTARLFNRSAATIAYTWNGLFVLSGSLVLCLMITGLHFFYRF